MKQYQDKICVISGGSRGIGFTAAKKFASEGAIVIAFSSQLNSVMEAKNLLSKSENKEYAKNIEIQECDISDALQRKQLLRYISDKYGRIDVLFLNHGILGICGDSLSVIKESDFDKVMSVNLKSNFFMIKEALPLLKPGSNILITSSLRSTSPSYECCLYALSKAALNNMVKSLGEGLLGRGIRINAIAPGIVSTDMGQGLINMDPQRYEKMAAKPEQIVDFILAICSPNIGSWLNGETYFIHGGHYKL
eukprot:403356166